MNYLNYFSSPYSQTMVYAPQPSYSMMHSGSAGSSNYAAAPTPLPTCVSPQALHRPSSQWPGPSSGSKRRHSVTPPTGDPYNVADPSNSHKRTRSFNARTPLSGMTRPKTPTPTTPASQRVPQQHRAHPNPVYVPHSSNLGLVNGAPEGRIFFQDTNGNAPYLSDLKAKTTKLQSAREPILRQNPLILTRTHLVWSFDWPGFHEKKTKMHATLENGAPVTRMHVAHELSLEIENILKKIKPDAQKVALKRSAAQRLVAGVYEPRKSGSSAKPPKYRQDMDGISPEWDLNQPSGRLYERLRLVSLDYYPRPKIWVPTLIWERS